MASKEEFQAYMKAAAGQIGGSKGPCPTTEALVAYRHGDGDENTREETASHLTLCADCREVLLDVRLFFDAASSDSRSTANIDREWARFAAATMARESGPARPPERKSLRWRWKIAWLQGPSLAWAAALGVVTVSGALWTVLSERREQAELIATRNRIASLEAENRSLKAAERSEIAALKLPRLDTLIFDVYSSASRERGDGSPRPNRFRLASGAPVVLILNGEGQANYPAYAMRMLDRHANPVWESDGLMRGADGNYAVAFPAGFLLEGEYRLEVFGIRDGVKAKIANYDVAISGKQP